MSIYEYQFYEYAQKKNVGFVKPDVHDFCLSCLLSVYPVSSESPPAPGMIIGIMENTVVNVVIRIGRILGLQIIIRIYTLISRFPAVFIHTADRSSIIC